MGVAYVTNPVGQADVSDHHCDLWRSKCNFQPCL